MRVIHQLPHPALSPYVQCYWDVGVEVPPGSTLDIPFGCTGSTHWMILLQSTFQTGFDDGRGTLSIYDSTLVGQATRPITHHFTSTVQAIMINFTPTGLHGLWTQPTDEFSNQSTKTESVLGQSTRSLVERLQNEPSSLTRFTLIDAFLLRRLWYLKKTDGRVEAAVHKIRQQPGFTSIRGLAHSLNCSERTLTRRFTETVGLSPKTYARVERFLQTQRWLQRDSSPDWHDLSATLGYYDQAHLIHEFNYFAGKSPLLYGVDNKPLLDFIRHE